MKQIINTDKAPSPVGPYNQSIRHRHTLYLSGQIALDPATGLLTAGDILAETRQVMKNIQMVLSEAGLQMEHLLLCTIYVKDMSQYDAINGVYAEFFDASTAPARALVEVRQLPKGANIEISAIAGYPSTQSQL